jgi:hypothetical protein
MYVGGVWSNVDKLIGTAVQLPTLIRRRGQINVRPTSDGSSSQSTRKGGADWNRPETPIPLSVFQRWYDNFTRKIENDRGASFLDRQD